MPINPSDLSKITDLLQVCGLPADDCADCIDEFIGCYDVDRLIAVGAIQTAGNYGQLRSLAVSPDFRARGLARRIVERLVDDASQKGLTRLYLLTETAAEFFKTAGFSVCPRDSAPLEVQQLKQFSSICPASADCLSLMLSN